MVNQDRLAQTFMSLVQIDSISKQEAAVCAEIRKILSELGAEIVTDNAGERIGGNAGNLIAKFAGNVNAPPLLLNAHTDTVEPGRNIKPVFKDGVFTSQGDTILGADDKSAVAILIEVMRILKEKNLPHGPIELVLTVCEETGLQGVKNMDFRLISAKSGYALDATDTEGIVTRAPAANKFQIRVYGKDAHAGAAPEKGINAIVLASKAIANLDIGRIDPETTCNIGIIEGGMATNIVPALVTVKGEVRSHDPQKLKAVTDRILSAFRSVVENYAPRTEDGLPRLEIDLEDDFSHTNIPDDHPVVKMAQQAADNLGRNMIPKITGGGADANIFFSKGIIVGVLGTGMRDMHTTRENIRLEDMVHAAELVSEIIRLHAMEA